MEIFKPKLRKLRNKGYVTVDSQILRWRKYRKAKMQAKLKADKTSLDAIREAIRAKQEKDRVEGYIELF